MSSRALLTLLAAQPAALSSDARLAACPCAPTPIVVVRNRTGLGFTRTEADRAISGTVASYHSVEIGKAGARAPRLTYRVAAGRHDLGTSSTRVDVCSNRDPINL
jgi:hypothetical protein